MKLSTSSALLAALLVASCSTVPERDAQVESARMAVDRAANSPDVVALAPRELDEARQTFMRADAAWRDRGDHADVDHLAYLAQQRAATG